ncbi:MAG TPA: hypothetical protein VIK59_02995 [Verrucomicrobiae bacterium]
MTKTFSIRLNDQERFKLNEILSSENCESENAGEWFRLLLHREWNKRKNLGVPNSVEFATCFRVKPISCKGVGAVSPHKAGTNEISQARPRRLSSDKHSGKRN